MVFDRVYVWHCFIKYAKSKWNSRHFGENFSKSIATVVCWCSKQMKEDTESLWFSNWCLKNIPWYSFAQKCIYMYVFSSKWRFETFCFFYLFSSLSTNLFARCALKIRLPCAEPLSKTFAVKLAASIKKVYYEIIWLENGGFWQRISRDLLCRHWKYSIKICSSFFEEYLPFFVRGLIKALIGHDIWLLLYFQYFL